MINTFDTAKALIDQINTISGVTVVHQGGTNAPTDGNQYLRTWVMPAATNVVTLQTGERQNGIFQIDVLTPKSQSPFVNKALVDIVRALFPQTSTYTNDGQTVKVMKTDVSEVMESGSYWFTAVSVNYVTFGN